ncbi:hypothetical protein EDB87DRAFT_164283 [Lactarius vividus]|nr:hypothetical protein EDB87DRAFT_164283 [Lactarius vividus]
MFPYKREKMGLSLVSFLGFTDARGLDPTGTAQDSSTTRKSSQNSREYQVLAVSRATVSPLLWLCLPLDYPTLTISDGLTVLIFPLSSWRTVLSSQPL